MGFSRIVVPEALAEAESLTRKMVGVGMNLSADPDPNANIEDTLLAASVAGVENDDLRTLAVLVTWLEIHHPWINASRLARLVDAQKSSRVRCFWAAVGGWLVKERRFSKLRGFYQGHRIDLLRTGTDFQVKRHGEDIRFRGGPMRIAANTLRNRPSDVLSPSELAERHAAYRCRLTIGPSYRADMWSELIQDSSLSSAELARRTYGSFATAWAVKRDFGLTSGGTVSATI